MLGSRLATNELVGQRSERCTDDRREDVEPERVLEIREAGADDYVRKARLADELPRVLAALLETAGRSARSRS